MLLLNGLEIVLPNNELLVWSRRPVDPPQSDDDNARFYEIYAIEPFVEAPQDQFIKASCLRRGGKITVRPGAICLGHFKIEKRSAIGLFLFVTDGRWLTLSPIRPCEQAAWDAVLERTKEWLHLSLRSRVIAALPRVYPRQASVAQAIDKLNQSLPVSVVEDLFDELVKRSAAEIKAEFSVFDTNMTKTLASEAIAKLAALHLPRANAVSVEESDARGTRRVIVGEQG